MIKTIIATEKDGLETRTLILNFEVPTKDFDIVAAAKKAASDFCLTERGKNIYSYNCHNFNWADFDMYVDNFFCEPYGFKKIDSEIPEIEVDWDEQLVSDTDGFAEITEFNCEENLAQYVDSMLFDSDTVIASMTCECYNGDIISVDLTVRGSVEVDYRGETYRRPSEFPDALKKKIKKHPHDWEYDNATYVDLNNWFEFIYDICRDGEEIVREGEIFERDLSKLSVEELKDVMHLLCLRLVKENI